jgi:AcrR family transcriptional regulator
MSAKTAIRSKARSGGSESAPRDRRGEIVGVAGRLFAERGFEATTVRQIADAVNILPGSLYHHFATKEDMLHDVLRAQMVHLVEENRKLGALPGDAENRLVASVIWRFRQYVEQWQFHAILVQDGRFFRQHPDFGYVVAAKAEAFTTQRAILQDGMSAGLFRADMDTYLMIGTIARMLSSGAAWFRSGDIFSADRPSRYTLDPVIDFHLECVLNLVRAPSRIGQSVPRAACEELLVTAMPGVRQSPA